MMVVPIIGIAAVLSYRTMGGKGESAPEVQDENVEMERLIAEVNYLEREGHEVMKLIRSESPQASKRAKAFKERAYKWLDDWELLTKDLRDEKGRLKEEYRGYDNHRRRVNMVVLDFNKSSGFFSD